MFDILKKYKIAITVIPIKPGAYKIVFRRDERHCCIPCACPGRDLSDVVLVAIRLACSMEKFVSVIGEECAKELRECWYTGHY